MGSAQPAQHVVLQAHMDAPVLCLQVAVKVANGVRTYSHDGSYQYDDFLQVEWRAHQRFSAHGAPSCGYPDILAAGAAPSTSRSRHPCRRHAAAASPCCVKPGGCVLCCCALPAGIHNFSLDLSDDRPQFMVSFLAMELLGPTCWEAANVMHAQQDAIVGGSAGWIDDDEELHMPARLPTTEWIVRTGQGMLKVGQTDDSRQQQHPKLQDSCMRVSQARLPVLPLD
jgi:hypothetical protein